MIKLSYDVKDYRKQLLDLISSGDIVIELGCHTGNTSKLILEKKMWIKNIKLKNFRNYNKEEINLEKNINIFYGENAQGKTNIIEAIFLCSLGK